MYFLYCIPYTGLKKTGLPMSHLLEEGGVVCAGVLTVRRLKLLQIYRDVNFFTEM